MEWQKSIQKKCHKEHLGNLQKELLEEFEEFNQNYWENSRWNTLEKLLLEERLVESPKKHLEKYEEYFLGKPQNEFLNSNS